MPSGPRAVCPAAFRRPRREQSAIRLTAVLPEVVCPGGGRTAVIQIALDQIEHNPYQTRYKFDQEALEELAESIRANGVVSPIVVRPGAEGGMC